MASSPSRRAIASASSISASRRSLVGLEDRKQAGHARAQGAVGVRQPLERLAEQRHALGVDRAVGADLREPERGAGQRVGVAVAPRGGRGLGVAAAAVLDVAGGEGRLGQRQQRRAALGGGRLGAERERLERLGVVAAASAWPSAAAASRAASSAASQAGCGSAPARAAASAWWAIWAAGTSAPASRRTVSAEATASCSAPRRCAGQRLAHGVADDPVGEREVPGGLARAVTSPADVPRSSAAATTARETPAARTRSAIVKRPATAPTSSTAHTSGRADRSGGARRRARARARASRASSPIRPSAAISRTNSAT